MRMCAGVQKLSRPMDMCHDMSQTPPIMPETMPPTTNQMVQGIEAALDEA
jgi:hypothetical protein